MPTNGFAWFLEALSHYVEFGGRARRREYWYFTLFNVVFGLVCGVVGGFFHARFVVSLYNLAMFLPGLAVGIRRLHDVGRTGWWVLVPIVNLVFFCFDSEPGPNRYGSSPKPETWRPLAA